MAHKNIYTDEMIQISGTWLEPGGKAYAAIVATPDLASSLPRLSTAHKGIAACEQPASTPRISAIMDEEGRLDIRHDAIIRGIWGTLTALAELIGGDAGTAFIVLRDTILRTASPASSRPIAPRQGRRRSSPIE